MRSLVRRIVLTMCVGLLPVMLTGCASTSTHQSTGEYIDHSAVTAKVKAAVS